MIAIKRSTIAKLKKIFPSKRKEIENLSLPRARFSFLILFAFHETEGTPVVS